jgi:integrase
MSDLLSKICSDLPERRESIESLWLALWVHPEGIGMEQIFKNLRLAIEERQLGQVQLPDTGIDTSNQLQQWAATIDCVLAHMYAHPECFPAHALIGTRDTGKHPIAGHGLTSHGIYAGCWNLHGLIAEAKDTEAQFYCKALRKIQLYCIELQAELITLAQINIVMYRSATQYRTTIGGDEKSHIDFVGKRCKVNTSRLGWVLRMLSEVENSKLLMGLHRNYAGGRWNIAEVSRRLVKPYGDTEKERIYENQIQVLNGLRLFVANFSEFKSRRSKGKRVKTGGSGSDGPRKIAHGHTGQLPDYIRILEKPDDLPEFDGWVDPEEILYDEDETLEGIEEGEDGTGLVTIDPSKIKGSLAKSRSQQHYMEMVHQYFLWDNASLTEAESILLSNKLQLFLSLSPEEIFTTEWKWASMNLVSWLFGVDLGSASEIQWGHASTILSSRLALISLEKTVEWRVTLRVSPSDTEEITGGLNRISELRIPDYTGLGMSLLRCAQSEGRIAGESIFDPWQTPEARIQKAKAVLRNWSLEHSDRNRIVHGRLERALLVQLMNMVHDKTIAWTLAGKPSSVNQSRMYYAVHTEAELSDWLLTAQTALVTQTWHTEPTRPVQSLVFAAQVRPATYVGARFFPDRQKVLDLVEKMRLSAQRHVPPDFLDPSISLISDGTQGDQYADFRMDGDVHETDRVEEVAHSKPVSHKSIKDWNMRATWCAWHDDVVIWTWLVQMLQSSMRPKIAPDILYQQWLTDPVHDWSSLEDKRTRDRDEARACLITPSLNEAYLTLTAVQESFQYRWATTDETAKPLPFGFVVFDGQETSQALTPTVAMLWIEKLIGEKWPQNFTRVLMRRALYERGLSSDMLDAFMGHGAIAGRVHDEHSLFDPIGYRNRLEEALNEFARSFGITRLYHRIHMSGDDERIKYHRKLAEREIQNRQDKVEEKSGYSDEYTRWCDAVHALTDDDMVLLSSLKPWYLNLVANSEDPYIFRFINLQKGMDNHSNYSVTAAMEAQGKLLLPLRKRMMNRSMAGHGLNLCYRISKALDPDCPTMHVVLKAVARVSPYTLQRVHIANGAHSQLIALQRMLSNAEDRDVAIFGLSIYLNTTLSDARIYAHSKQGEMDVVPNTLLKERLAKAYSYRLKNSDGKIRKLRGHIDALFSLSPHAQRVVSKTPAESYRNLRKRLKGRFELPLKMSTWANTIRWMLCLNLPPLLVSHAAGLLSDQSSSGPAFENEQRFHAGSIGEDPITLHDELDVRPNLTQAISTLQSQAKGPFIWLDEADREVGPVALWLDEYLVSNMGLPSESACAMNFSIAELDRVLYEALFDVPTGHRLSAQKIIRVLRKKYGIHGDDSDYPDRIDCEVIDWDSFERVLAALESLCIAGRNVARTKRLRMLLVLAFRLGMRRREILGLRRVDVEMGRRGCIHVRAWFDRELKTLFSQRSLPISSLLSELEQTWLAELCETLKPGDLLFPQHEHDTLSREAITLLRETLGNNDLKIHHLRHSFASLLLLKLVVARNPSWKAAFQNWDALQKELSTAHELIGTVVKPWDASGDLLAIARLLGHSSYQVTLANYLHTLDIALALFQAYVLRDVVVPARLQGLVHKSRFATVRAKLASLSTETQLVPENVDTASIAIRSSSKKTSVTSEVKKSFQIQQWLLDAYRQEPASPKARDALQSFGISNKDIVSWFSPLKAARLVEQLNKLADVLSDMEMKRLVELGLKYWQAATPMYWLSAGRSVHDPDRMVQILEDGKELVALLLMAIPPESIVFCSYSGADREAHARLWAPVMSLADRARVDWKKSSSATATAALGISIAIDKIRCPLVTGIWLAACKGILSKNVIQSDEKDERKLNQILKN